MSDPGRSAIFGGMALALLSLGCGGSHARDCEQVTALFYAEPAWRSAPEQADMSNEAQSRNWAWRADQAAQRSTAIGAVSVQDEEARGIRDAMLAHYAVLAREARATSSAFASGDTVGIALHSGAFDAQRDGPLDVLTARVVACH